MRVGAVLRDHDLRPEHRGERRDQAAHAGEPRVLPRIRLEGQVDRRAGCGPRTELVGGARPREQVPAALVEGHGEHAGIAEADRLDAVAVVDVEVDVQDPQALAAGADDRERRVVVDAEARRAAGIAWWSPPPG